MHAACARAAWRLRTCSPAASIGRRRRTAQDTVRGWQECKRAFASLCSGLTKTIVSTYETERCRVLASAPIALSMRPCVYVTITYLPNVE
eukprot:3187392-Pleurochrysis_carterae.AAC.2